MLKAGERKLASVVLPRPSSLDIARQSNRATARLADILHDIGLTIMVLSILANFSDLIVLARRFTKPHWLSSLNAITPYAVWVGLGVVFAGIVVRDGSWRRPESK